jgi:hypothetical protein
MSLNKNKIQASGVVQWHNFSSKIGENQSIENGHTHTHTHTHTQAARRAHIFLGKSSKLEMSYMAIKFKNFVRYTQSCVGPHKNQMSSLKVLLGL